MLAHNNNIINDNPEIGLAEAKNMLRNTIDPHISLHTLRVLNRNVYQLFECDLVYLHLQIIFATPNDVNDFLENYSNLHGVYATQMFVNHSIHDQGNGSDVTPMDVAMMWNTDPTMLRVLYRWGSNPRNAARNTLNNFNNLTLPVYSNYLQRYNLIEHNNNYPYNYPELRGRRIRNEFYGVIQENVYLAQVVEPPNDRWVLPQRIPIPQHNDNNIYQY